MMNWYIFHDDGVEIVAGRTAQKALAGFDCPKGAAILAILRQDVVTTPSPSQSGISFVPMMATNPTGKEVI
jgi:hypothetical protein